MAELGELWAEQALPLSLQVGALVLAAAVLTLLLRRAAPRVRYAVWLLVVARAVVPVALATPIGVLPLAPSSPPQLPALPGCEEAAVAVPETGAASSPQTGPATEAEAPPVRAGQGWMPMTLAGGWLLGVGALGTCVALRHRRLRREIAAGVRPPAAVETFVERQRERLGVAEPVVVRVHGGAGSAGPAVVGALRPVLVLPAWMATAWDEQAWGPLVVHELVHLRRRDGWVNLLVTVVQVLYFFHPLVWLATWLLVKERERVCDDEVVAAYEGRSEPYVRALCRYALAPVGEAPVPGLSSLAASRADLVRRIERLAEPGYRTPGRRFVSGGLAVVAVVACLVASLGARETGGAGTLEPELDLPADLPRLEAYLRERPDDLEARFAALDAYFSRGLPEDRDRLRPHALHMAEADAELPDVVVRVLTWAAANDEWLADRILSHWTGRLQDAPRDVGLLRRVTTFAAMHRPELAADLAARGQELAPTDPFWPRHLGEIALARDPEALADASREFQRAARLATGAERYQDLAAAARAELAAGSPGEARRLASLVLAEAGSAAGTWYQGNALHEAHVLLGFAALARGEVEGAERHLRMAAEVPASPQLRSFGPDVGLAETLLDLGRTRAVLDYLDACHRFWETGHERLDDWATRIHQGERPDFGASRRLLRR